MKLRLVATYILLIIAACLIGIGPHRLKAPADITDISWPNCNDNLDLLTAERGIVGGLGGLNFHKNACLGHEDRFKITDVYLNTGYAGLKRAKAYASKPKTCTDNDEPCLAYNYGYSAADYAVNQLLSSGVMPPRIWLDVEFGNSWSDDASINRIVITGMHDRLMRLAPVGIYSYPFQWKIITGDWLNGLPVWTATGSTKRTDAVKACSQSFTGGPVLLAQYTPGKYDQNIACQPLTAYRP